MEYQVVIIKTVIGEEIIGKLKGVNDKGVDILDPLMIKYRYNDIGAPTVYFTKYPFFTKSFEAYFKMEGVVHIFYDVLDSVIDYYEKNLRGIKRAYEREEKSYGIDGLFDQENDEDEPTESEIEEQVFAWIERMQANTTIQ